MAKAVYTTATGATVSIEGSAGEVAEMLRQLEGPTRKRVGSQPGSRTRNPPTRRKGVIDYLIILRDAGFFKTPRSLGEAKEALGRDGHLVPSSAAAVALLRLVRRRALQRSKVGGVWKYGNR